MLNEISNNTVECFITAVGIGVISGFCSDKFPACLYSSVHGIDLALEAVSEHLIYVLRSSISSGYLYHKAQLKQLFQVVNGWLVDADTAIALERH